MNGRLRQVIPGHNVVCIDDGSKVPGSLNGNAQIWLRSYSGCCMQILTVLPKPVEPGEPLVEPEKPLAAYARLYPATMSSASMTAVRCQALSMAMRRPTPVAHTLDVACRF
jgi:hypothetical protein